MIFLNDICWAAGFLEGEGYFRYHQNQGRVTAVQVQREPLEKLGKFFFGKIYRTTKNPNPRAQRSYIWTATGARAIGIMMTLYSLMSPERKAQIKKALDPWRASPPLTKYRTHCKWGHAYSLANTIITKGGQRTCRQCRRVWNRKKNARRRKLGIGHSKSQLTFHYGTPENISNE